MLQLKNHTALRTHVLRTLLYYDLFRYPLTSNEVFRFLGMNSVSAADVEICLNNLAEEKYITRFDPYYSVQAGPENVRRRTRGNQQAARCLTLARKQARLIGSFPFVLAVMASGSLSKGYMDDASDLDFFIITKAKRLWISRTLLVLFKRLFLKNSHKLFCVNYFIDRDHLEIEEKNLFTATELATVIPLYGGAAYRELMGKNTFWLKTFFPNYQPLEALDTCDGSAKLKRIFEITFNLLLPSLVNRLLMRMTLKRWMRLYGNTYSASDFNIAFKTTEYASKNHPRNFQKKIMERYRETLEEYSVKAGLDCRL